MYYVLNTFSILLSALPPKALVYLAHTLSWFLFSILRVRRKLVLNNIATAMGPQISHREKVNIGYHSLFHFILTALEFLAERQGGLGDGVRFEGEEHLQAALKQGKGAYILCIHLGSWEAMCSAMTRRIKPSHVIVKKVGSEGTNRFILNLRQRNGFNSVARRKKGDGMKAIRQILGKGEVVGFVMDQARPGEPLLPFFGRPAKTNTSFAAIWQKAPAPIIPAFIKREAYGKHTLTFREELSVDQFLSEPDPVLAMSKYFNSVVESMILEAPEQYFWMHNRWK